MIIAIDPSGNFEKGKGITGIAFKGLNQPIQHHTIRAKDFDNYGDYWNDIVFAIRKIIHYTPPEEPTHLIIESFVVRSNGYTTGTMPETIQLIGLLRFLFEYEYGNLAEKVVLQSPNQVKGRFNDDILLNKIDGLERKGKLFYYKGKVVGDHVRDAMRHLLYYEKYGGNKE